MFSYIFTVLKGSQLIGMTIGEVEDKYNVEIEYYHKPKYGYKRKFEPESGRRIEKELTLKVKGGRKELRRMFGFKIEEADS